MNSDFARRLLDWYGANRRDLPWRHDATPYRVWVSEIMLQQTRVAAVIPYYERFLAAYPDERALAAADDGQLHKLWEGLGYYSRVRNMKRAAARAVESGGGLPHSYAGLLALPGIGEYTAGAVASIACGERVPAVDGNVLRVAARLRNDDSDVGEEKTKQRVRAALAALLEDESSPAHADPGGFNAAMMELGALLCVPNGPPKCAACPVSAFCAAYAAGTAELLPVKRGKKPRRVEEKTVFALRLQDGPYLSLRRPETGLLAGLWQLPEAAGVLSDREMAERLADWGLRPVGELAIYSRKHVFTHIEWHMRVCAATVAAAALPEGWAPLDEGKALPTAYRVCLPQD